MTWIISMALANAALVIPLAALAFLVSRFSRRPALAHVLWIVVLVKLVTPPLVEIPIGWRFDLHALTSQASTAADETQGIARWPRGDADPAPPVKRANDQAPSMREVQSAAAARHDSAVAKRPALVASSPKRLQGWAPTVFTSASALRALALVWLVGSAAILMLYSFRAWRFQRFLNLATRRDKRLNERAARLARAVGLSRSVQVVVVDSVVSPLLWGVGSSARLVFPAPLARQLDDRACDSLLLHELAHFSRGDHWVRLLELAVQVVYWWHPVVWWGRREIEAAEEQCCDAWVVERQEGSRRSYAEALLATLDFLCDAPSPLPPAACGLGDAPFLRQRLTQIMQGEIATRLSPRMRVAVLAGAIFVLPLGPALFASSSRSPVVVRPSKSAVAKVEAEQRQSAVAKEITPPTLASPGNTLPTAAPASNANENAPARAEPPRPVSVLWASAASPGGKYRLEARTGHKSSLVHALSDWRLDLSAHQITCASFAPDGRTFATGHEDRVVRLWDSESGGVQMSLKGCEAEITSVAISPDGRQVAAGDADGRVLVWNLITGDESARLARQDAPVRSVRWSSRGDRLAVCVGDWAGSDHAALLVWAPQEGVVLAQLGLDKPTAVADWLPGDKALVVASWNGDAQVFSLESGESISELSLGKDGKDLVSAAAWSPDCLLVPRWSADRLAAGVK